MLEPSTLESSRDLLTVSKKDAREMLEIIVRSIETGEDIPWCMWKEDSNRLKARMDGPLFDKLCDASGLDPEERCRKWKREEEEEEERRECAFREGEDMKRREEERRRKDEDQRRAYLHLKRKRRYRKKSWIFRDDSYLSSRPPCFWNSIQLEKMTDEERRATIHRVKMLQKEMGRASVTAQFRRSCSEAEASLPEADRRRRRIRSRSKVISRLLHLSRPSSLPQSQAFLEA